MITDGGGLVAVVRSGWGGVAIRLGQVRSQRATSVAQ